MTWYEITLAVAGTFGGIELLKFLWDKIFNRKNNSRIANTEAANAEIEVEKNKVLAEAEKIKAMENAHAVERHQYEERIAELHKSLDKANEQINYYIERDIEKEKRFVEQTNLLREVQKARLLLEKEKAEMEVMYLKRINELELELEKKRCDWIVCPYRKPPTAHTLPKDNITIDEYFSNKVNDKNKL